MRDALSGTSTKGETWNVHSPRLPDGCSSYWALLEGNPVFKSFCRDHSRDECVIQNFLGTWDHPRQHCSQRTITAALVMKWRPPSSFRYSGAVVTDGQVPFFTSSWQSSAYMISHWPTPGLHHCCCTGCWNVCCLMLAQGSWADWPHTPARGLFHNLIDVQSHLRHKLAPGPETKAWPSCLVYLPFSQNWHSLNLASTLAKTHIQVESFQSWFSYI